MRTTIDLPDDLHQQLLSIARDSSKTLSQTATDLLRRALTGGGAGGITMSGRTGLPVVRLGTTITTDDVRALDDE